MLLGFSLRGSSKGGDGVGGFDEQIGVVDLVVVGSKMDNLIRDVLGFLLGLSLMDFVEDVVVVSDEEIDVFA